MAGAASRSTLAVRNITGLCEAEIPGRYRLEIINVYQQPSRAAEDQISAVPTLVKISPLPRRKLIGDLSQDAQVGRSLGFRDLPGSEPASNS